MAASTARLVASVIGANGKRTSAVPNPSLDTAYLTGAGFVSRNSASCNGYSRSWISSALPKSPASVASWNSAHKAGATLAVTEIQPRPPCALNANAVASSPDKRTKSLPHCERCAEALAISAVASLTPTTLRSFAHFAIVAGCMSATVRDGTL